MAWWLLKRMAWYAGGCRGWHGTVVVLEDGTMVVVENGMALAALLLALEACFCHVPFQWLLLSLARPSFPSHVEFEASFSTCFAWVAEQSKTTTFMPDIVKDQQSEVQQLHEVKLDDPLSIRISTFVTFCLWCPVIHLQGPFHWHCMGWST